MGEYSLLLLICLIDPEKGQPVVPALVGNLSNSLEGARWQLSSHQRKAMPFLWRLWLGRWGGSLGRLMDSCPLFLNHNGWPLAILFCNAGCVLSGVS